MAVRDRPFDNDLAGLDALDLEQRRRERWPVALWRRTWPVLLAVAISILVWQVVVWSGWRSEYILPSPFTVLARFGEDFANGRLLEAAQVTLARAVVGYAIALGTGTLVGAGVVRIPVVRTAIGSLITGLQTMPSIAWFPLAIVLFTPSEAAILFVVVLGAAPSVANGFISGVDHVPPLLLRAGRALGARGFQSYRYVILPAALPAYVAGLKQAWAFAWRSLMAGELLVIVSGRTSIGAELQHTRDLADYQGMFATMLLIFFIGVLVDALLFSTAERVIRRRRGLTAA